MTMFERAERRKQKLRLALEGPSGSGKTYSALQIAKGLTADDLERVAVIDTENGSASLYANQGAFGVLDLRPPYSPQRYIEAIRAAEAEGFEVVVIDSLSHAWSKEGGLLDYVDSVAAAKTNGNTFSAWKDGGKVENELMGAMLQSRCHVIATMRTKVEWVVEENDRGKKVPRKVGMAPDQRKDIDYEFTLVLDLSREHIATASKDRTSLFDKQFFTPSPETGVQLLEWLRSGAEPPAIITPAQLGILRSWCVSRGKSIDGLRGWLAEGTKVGTWTGPIETLPLTIYEKIVGDWQPAQREDFNTDLAASAAAPAAAPATAVQPAAAKPAAVASPSAEPADPKPAAASEAPAEASDHGVVHVYWPEVADPVTREVGKRTRFGELVAHYLTSLGLAEEPSGFAVVDPRNDAIRSQKDVIPASAWDGVFRIVKLESQPAAAVAEATQNESPESSDQASGPSDEEAERELEERLGPSPDLSSAPPADKAKRTTLAALSITCDDLQKAGWTEDAWRDQMSALTGGKRSRKQLTEAEAKRVLNSLKYELQEAQQPAMAS